MTDLTTLQSLRDRVANAGDGTDMHLLDMDILTTTAPLPNGAKWRWFEDDPPDLVCLRVTSSIDAALALVGRVLPNDFVRIEQLTRSRWQVRLEGSEGVSWANAPTAALAIILALLNALIAKENTDGV